MKGFLSIVKKCLSEYAGHMTGSKIKEFQSEDPLSQRLLKQKLLSDNSERIVFFTPMAALVCVIFGIVTIASMNLSSLTEFILTLIGLLIILFGCSFSAVLIFRENSKKHSDEKKLDKMIFAYWLVFSLGLLFIIISDYSCCEFSYRFCFYLIIMTVFPLFDTKRSVFIISPLLIMTIIFGLVFKADILTLLLSIAFSLAYVVVSSLVYSSCCCLFISGRRLNNANERVRQINEKDALTGLLNKKGLIRRLTGIIDKGADKNIAAIFFNIDDFRRFNQIHTDAQSDECLYNICNCIRIIAKTKTDIISRFGGDEFVIIVQNTAEYDLVYFAEQIRKSVETMAIPFENGKNVSITVGISSIVEGEFSDYSALLKEAEDNLALAKRGGKNCVGYLGNVFRNENSV